MKFSITYFNGDVVDASEFDMVLNTKSFSEEALCKTIQFAIEGKTTSAIRTNE